MKIWEKCNELKGTNAPYEEIRSWAYMNRICPIEFRGGLELYSKYPTEMENIAHKICVEQRTCKMECLDKFLNSELETQK